jgi:hypothetical protein
MVEKRRLAFAIAGIVVLAVAALVAVLGGGAGDDRSGGSSAGDVAATVSVSGATGATSGSDEADDRELPTRKPLLEPGKVTSLEVEQDDEVSFRIRVPSDDELHVHGYDITRALPAGETVEVSFKADLEGVFEIELHETGEQVGKLTVNP